MAKYVLFWNVIDKATWSETGPVEHVAILDLTPAQIPAIESHLRQVYRATENTDYQLATWKIIPIEGVSQIQIPTSGLAKMDAKVFGGLRGV